MPDPRMEKQALKNQADALQSELDFVKKRLSEIETETAGQ
jgi:prefoldin subunit 5